MLPSFSFHSLGRISATIVFLLRAHRFVLQNTMWYAYLVILTFFSMPERDNMSQINIFADTRKKMIKAFWKKSWDSRTNEKTLLGVFTKYFMSGNVVHSSGTRVQGQPDRVFQRHIHIKTSHAFQHLKREKRMERRLPWESLALPSLLKPVEVAFGEVAPVSSCRKGIWIEKLGGK